MVALGVKGMLHVRGLVNVYRLWYGKKHVAELVVDGNNIKINVT
jgi:hypothetical protein